MNKTLQDLPSKEVKFYLTITDTCITNNRTAVIETILVLHKILCVSNIFTTLYINLQYTSQRLTSDVRKKQQFIQDLCSGFESACYLTIISIIIHTTQI